MANSIDNYNGVVTSVNFFVKGKQLDKDQYYDLGLNPDTLKQNKYDKLADKLHKAVTDPTVHKDLIDVKKAAGGALDSSIFGDLYNNGRSQFYFRNRLKPNIIV